MHVVLGSASPARLATLRAAGVHPEVLVSGVDEDGVVADSPAALAWILAELKGYGGMVLVRDGTPESDERQRQPGLLMIPFEAGGVRYWICSR